MAGVLVGSAVLSGFFNVLFDRAATREFLKFLLPDEDINFERLLWELKGLLWSADVLMDDAEEKRILDTRVEKWLFELKDVVFKAGEVVDKIETEALRLKMEGGQSTSLFSTHVQSELEEIHSSLKFLLERKDELGLQKAGRNRSSDVRARLPERPIPFVSESDFCGREDIKETIMRSLRSAEVGGDKVSVIPVIGAGGLGKTTLVRIIYDHSDVKQLFRDDKEWVTVSTKFDLPAISKEIIRKVSSSSQRNGDENQQKLLEINGDENQQKLLEKMRDALKGKKFLLVLDDVWSEDHRVKWECLKSCFMSGSKIIVTTRNRKVASIMAPNQPHHVLQELPEKDCLKLFAQTVFVDDEDRDANPDLQEIGEKIVRKCKGNPLSVRSVGGILCGERHPEKWEKILESSLWELLQKDSEDIIPSLWLSYLYLPSEIKPCFAYCSIFPKDYPFQKEDVVRQWMAVGFLKNEAEKLGITMEEVGKQYFEELISRSLFQRSKEIYYSFIMHDLVHDLAMKVSGEFFLCLEGEKNLRDISCKTRYLSCNMKIQDGKIFEGLSKAKRLHSFVGLQKSGGDMLKVLEELAMEGVCLRVLSFSPWYTMEYLPDSIGDLKHLRYLKSRVEKLPDSVCTLYNLQTLLLPYCEFLTQLPSNIGRLINLRHLETRILPLKEMPPHMCNLTKLQTLTHFGVGKRGSSIRDLGALHDLNGELCISGLQNVDDDDLKGNLVEDKKNLSKLVLEWGHQTDDSRDTRKEKTVLDALQPHANLKELLVYDYGGTSFPDWLGDSLFSKIEMMHLDGCQNCLFLPSLGRLPSLKELKMERFQKLETIDDGFYGNDSPFKSLEVLHFEDMPEWKKWSIIEVPRLKELKLQNCPKLVDGLPNCNTLTTLRICSCPKLEFPGNIQYDSLENLTIESEALKSFPLDYFPKLKELNLSNCQNFESFWFAGELPLVLESFDLSYLPKFVSFPEGGLPAPSLKAFYISECENLRSLPQQMRSLLPSLNYLEVKYCGEIETWPEGGLPSNLESLLILDCKKLAARVMHWDLQTVTPCLRRLEIDGCGEELLDSFGLLPTSLTSLEICNFRRLKTLNIQAFQQLKQLSVCSCDELQCLSEESLPNSLAELYIDDCPLLERRYRKRGEGWDKISHIPSVIIDSEYQH